MTSSIHEYSPYTALQGSVSIEHGDSMDTDDDNDDGEYEAVFIRAPVITRFGDEVEVLATVTQRSPSAEAKGDGTETVVVAVQQGMLLATSFHPELTPDTRWHAHFVGMIRNHA